jgi:hypothetical protein
VYFLLSLESMIVVSLQRANWGARFCGTLMSYAKSAFVAATALYQFYVSTGIVFVWFRIFLSS